MRQKSERPRPSQPPFNHQCTSLTSRFWLWLEQQPTSKKNVLVALLIAFLLAIPGLLESIWDHMNRPLPRVTIRCEGAAFPLRLHYGNQAVYGFELSPGWGSQLQMATPRSVPQGKESLWPTDTEILDLTTWTLRSGLGYLCHFTNHSDTPLTEVRLVLRVTYRKPGASYREPIQFTLPHPIEALESFAFYLVDDTGWDPKIDLPAQISAKVVGDGQLSLIPVLYSGAEPTELGGFEPVRTLPLTGPSRGKQQ